ncbi:glycosyltransferase family 4 protein [Halobacillus aidingensis]|uniref:Glycosyltransferase involved in cell wall bisynthesis n=1 Tax=Halobacillus aidingensis TaxID=240303 RepID=A0A1H0KJT6_HALAD|nr:glycosyltransferase family 4 protein [Halobacillus aidingensis]SDO55991.1 Glycosyltransferase involved in cell wall bisynthesis [Halobacillus aidingensis]
MKNVIFITYLNLWSMDKNKGAPSLYKTIDAYIKNGWNVTLINPEYNQGVTPELEGVSNITFKPIFYPLLKVNKISFFGRILHSIQGEYMFNKLARKALNELGGKAVIYAYEVHGVKAGQRLAKELKLPFITRFQGTILAPIKENTINKLKLYPHFDAIKSSADLTIMTDDGTQGDRVLQRLKNKSKEIFFWKNGVDIDVNEPINEEAVLKLRRNLKLAPNDKVLVTVSRLVSWKKVNRAIEAMPEIIKENPDVKLVIVGDGEDKLNLQRLVEELNLKSNVIFAGAVPQVEVKHYLSLGDVFLSLYDLSNVGNPLLEAMSVGKPLITLNVGDTSTLIDHEENGILLNLDQISLIPKYILEILSNQDYSKKLGDNAKQYAETNFWTWDERMKAELRVVDELVEEKGL